MNKNIVLIRNAQPYDFGGGERFPVFISQALKSEGFYPTVVSRSKSLRTFASENDIPIIKGWWWAHQNWSGRWALLFPVYLVWQGILIAYYLTLFIRLNPSAVHIQSKDDFIAGTFAAKVLGKRVIWTDHADLKHIWLNVRHSFKNPVGKLIYLAAQHTNTISVVSQSEKKAILDNLTPTSKVAHKLSVVYNGAFDHYNNKSKQQKESFIYTCVSRLVTDKGISELIKAFLEVQKIHPDVILWLIGEGRERQKFEKAANNNDGIIFHGQQADPIQYLAQSSVFVHPTYHEGFSLALVEASMMKLPIIATNVGGNPEIIIDRQTGLLVPAKDVEALTTAMNELRENVDLRLLLGENARNQYVSTFNFDVIVKNKFIPFYKGTN